jgi:hypothetical protein
MSSLSPYALRLSIFRAPGWGTLAVLPPCRWRNATSRKLVPFNHRSASTIFVRQPGRIPSPVVTQDGDHQFDGGEKRAGLRSWSRLSFKDLHHPGWGGGRAEPELYLPRGFVGHLPPQHSRERALTGLAGGSDFDNAGLVGGERRQLQRVGLAGSAGFGSVPGAPSGRESGCRAARTGGPPGTSRAARAAFVFWGCPAFAPVRRLCMEVSAPLVREDPSGDLPVGRWLPSSVLRWWRLKKSSSPTGSPPPSVLRASGSLALIACPRPSSGDVGEGIVAAASALRPSPLQFGHLERRSLSLLPERAAVSHLEPCHPAGPPMWGVVRTRGGGTGVPCVMAP